MKDRIVKTWDQVQLSASAEQRIKTALLRGPDRSRRRPRFSLAAVMAALVFVLSTVAVAATLDRIWLTVEPISLEEGRQGSFLVSFQPTDTAPIDLGSWYPQWLPEGFEEYYVGSDEHGIRTIIFENDKDFICLSYGKASADRSWLVTGVDEVQECRVGQRDAVLLTRTGAEDGYEHRRTLGNQGIVIPLGTRDQILLWDDGERGVGFILDYVGDRDLDLIRIAESVALMKKTLEYSYANNIRAAICKLGDYQPGYLPEGFTLEGVYGMPAYPLVSQEDYGYVHQVYVDEEFYRLELYYEFLPRGTASQARDIGREDAYENVQVEEFSCVLVRDDQGQPEAVFWQHTDEYGIRLLFTVKADRLTAEELIQVARSVYCAQSANTDRLDLDNRRRPGYNP